MIPQLITAAVIGALSPIPALVTIVFLSSRRAVLNTVAMLLGWSLVLAGLAALVLALVDPHAQATDHGAKGIVSLLVGVLLFGAGLRALIGAQHPLAAPAAGERAHERTPAWMTKLDVLPAWQALGLGMVLILVSPADIAAFVAAVQALAGQHYDAGARLIVLVVLILCIDLCILIPLLVYVLMPRRAADLLNKAKLWLIPHQRAVTGWSSLVFGIVMIINSLATLL